MPGSRPGTSVTRYGSLYCRLLAGGLVVIVCSLAIAETPRRAPHPLDGLSFPFAKEWREKACRCPTITTQHPALSEFQEAVRRADILVRVRIVRLADPQQTLPAVGDEVILLIQRKRGPSETSYPVV